MIPRPGCTVVAALLAFVVTGSFASAQVITGRVLESGSRTPVPWTAVALVDTSGADVAATIADEHGRFQLIAPRPGDYFIRAVRMGYGEVIDGILELGAGGRISLDFFLRPDPFELEEIRVAERRHVERYLEWQGFYRRMRVGAGAFLTPEDIERAGAIYDVPSLLQRLPFVQRLDRFGFGSTVQLLGRGGRCRPMIYVDAVRWTGSLDDYVHPDDLLAAEVFRGPAQAPLEYGGLFQGCGVVLLWTKWGQMLAGR